MVRKQPVKDLLQRATVCSNMGTIAMVPTFECAKVWTLKCWHWHYNEHELWQFKLRQHSNFSSRYLNGQWRRMHQILCSPFLVHFLYLWPRITCLIIIQPCMTIQLLVKLHRLLVNAYQVHSTFRLCHCFQFFYINFFPCLGFSSPFEPLKSGSLFQSFYFAAAAFFGQIKATWPHGQKKLCSTSTPATAASAAESDIFREYYYKILKTSPQL